MAPAEQQLRGKPRAEAIPVEDLVDQFLQGQIRIPSFQRRLKWGPSDVLQLFDSIYRGFPIGSLLMWKRRLGPQRLRVGPFDMEVEERGDAWLVIDGQQRLISLAAALRHPAAEQANTTEIDAFTLFFDLEKDEFRAPTRSQQDQEDTFLVPVHRLFDAVDLSEWLADRPKIGRSSSRRAHAVGKAIREYRVPVYVVETEDESVVREIFERVNNFGVALTQAEVFDAIVGSRGGTPGGGNRLADLIADLGQVGMGVVSEGLALNLVLATAGRDSDEVFCRAPRARWSIARTPGAVAVAGYRTRIWIARRTHIVASSASRYRYRRGRGANGTSTALAGAILRGGASL